MNYLDLKLDNDTYELLNKKFNGDKEAMEAYVKEIVIKEIKKTDPDSNKSSEKKNDNNLENYLKSARPGSRSYGIKGQGW